MRKWLLAFLAVGLLAATSACGTKTVTTTDPVTGVTTTTQAQQNLSDRQKLASIEIAVRDIFGEIQFLHQTGRLSDDDIETIEPYASAVMLAIKNARVLVMQGKPPAGYLTALQTALEKLIEVKLLKQNGGT